MSRRCTEVVWMPNSCCTCDYGRSVSNINIRQHKYVQKVGQLFKTKNGGWRQRTEENGQLWKPKLMHGIFFRCWPVRADIKNSSHTHCKLQCVMFVPDLNPKSTMIKNPRLPQGVVPLLLVVHYFPYEHGTFWVVSDTQMSEISSDVYIYTPQNYRP